MSRRITVAHRYRRGWLFHLVTLGVLLGAILWIPGGLGVSPAAQWVFAALLLIAAATQFLRQPPKHTLALIGGHVDWRYGYLSWSNPVRGPAALVEDSDLKASETWEPLLVGPHARWRLVLATASRILWAFTVPLGALLTIDALVALPSGGCDCWIPWDGFSLPVPWLLAAANGVVLLACYGLCAALLRVSTIGLGLPEVRRPVAHLAGLHAFSNTKAFMHPDTGRIHHGRARTDG